MYTVIVDNIENEFNVLGLLCTVLYGKKIIKLYLKATIHAYD